MVVELPHGDVGRELNTQQVHYHWVRFTAAELKEKKSVGVLPRRALVTQILVFVDEAMTGKKVQVGTESTAAYYGQTADGAIGIKEIKPAANAVWKPSDDEIEIFAKTDSAADSGSGSVVILYVADI